MSEQDSDNYTSQQQLVRIVATIDQPDKFAKVFCEATKTQKAIDDALRTIVKSLLEHDKEARVLIKTVVREVEKEDLLFLFKKIGFAGWTLFVAVAGATMTAIIKSLSSH